MDIKAALKEPWVKYALAGLGAVALLMMVRRAPANGGTGAVSDPNAVAMAQIAQRSADQQSAQSFQLALAGTNAALEKYKIETGSAAQLAIAQMATSAQTHAQDVAASTQISLAGIQQQAAATQVAGTVALGNIQATNAAQIAAITTKATTDQAGILAHTQEVLSQMAANVAVTQSNNAANVAVNQSNNNANVAITQSNNAMNASNTSSNNQKSSSMWQTVGSIASVVAAFL